MNGPDTETDTYRRAYIRARSTLDPDGVTPHESRMDILDSEVSYLVVAAVEAGQPVPPDVVAFARAEPLARKLRGTAADAVAARCWPSSAW